MTDERPTQTAAPSPNDGESTDHQNADAATTTATAAPPEEPAAETATEAEQSAAQDPEAGETEKAEAEEAKAEAEEAKAETEEAKAETEKAEAETAETEEAKAEVTEPAEARAGEAEAREAEAEPEAAAAGKAETETETEEEPAAEAEAEPAETAAATSAEPAPAEPATGQAAPADTGAAAAAAAAAAEDEDAAEDGDEEDDDSGAEAAQPELDDPTLKELRKAKEEGTVVTGKVIGWNRGGFHVVIDEVTAFCPSSEMELGRPKSPNAYMDRELEFEVVKFQRRGRRVVLSRAGLLKKERDQVLEGLSKGDVVTGIVTSLPDFGAFVDLGGVEGLVHVSELSRQRVAKPTDMLELGQQVEVKVLKIEKGGDRISLSMKALEPNPWDDVAKTYPRGSEFEGKVLRKADFGLFVELEPDVEGLIHVSQFPPGKSIDSDDVQPGNTVQGWVREVEPKRERISLSLREVPEDDPWKTVTERFPEGEMVEGTVESIAPFGVFINLAPGLTGLLPNSETGLPRGTSPARVYHPGQTTEVQVLSIDTRRKRISLGQKGSRVEATKADLQEYKKQQKQQEDKVATGAMAAAFARLKGDLDLPAEDPSE